MYIYMHSKPLLPHGLTFFFLSLHYIALLLALTDHIESLCMCTCTERNTTKEMRSNSQHLTCISTIVAIVKLSPEVILISVDVVCFTDRKHAALENKIFWIWGFWVRF